MMGLSDGRKSFRIPLAVLIQYRSVTDTQPATQPPSHPPSHVAVAVTLNALAKASSLKMDGMTDEPDVVVEEYEEVIGNLDELSDRVEIEDAEAESIQEPTSIDRRNLTTHTG